jgi:murein DD-endopeptidase MepM/ murein hydrolase activator NlpD
MGVMDKKRFTITINDNNGIKQYNLHEVIKKIAIYGALAIVVIFALGAFFIFYLNYSLDTITRKTEAAKVAYSLLEKKNEKLVKDITIREKSIEKKSQELNIVSDKLTDIEELIGLRKSETHALEIPLIERIGSISLSSQNVAYMFENVPNGSPLKRSAVTSKYGYRQHPTLKKRIFHRGLDFRARINTPIYATASAVVNYAGYNKRSGYGNLIILDHAFGFRTYYGHLNKVAVKGGQYIQKGDLIGYTGNTGISSGPHLHYEIQYIQRVLDPTLFVSWSAKNYKEIFKKEKRVAWQYLITGINHQKSIITQPSLRKDLLSKERWSSPAHFILMETLKAPFTQVLQSQWDEMAKLMAKSMQKN